MTASTKEIPDVLDRQPAQERDGHQRISIALCLIASSAAAGPKKTLRGGLTDAEYSSSKTGKRSEKIVSKQLVVHPPLASRPSRSGRK
jgi:hypothetical protein